MDNPVIAIGVTFGVAALISIIFLWLMCLYNQRRNASEKTGVPNQQKNGIDQQDVETSSQNEGVNTNDGPHLWEENYLYAFDEVKLNQRNSDEVDDMSDAVSPQNEDDVKESKMYVSADEVKLNKKQSNNIMKDADMTYPSQNEDANTNSDNYFMKENVVYASADEVVGVVQS